ncbi:MAG: sulfite exporter TauE/SafE family protein, partial [Candidatus Sulfotelmatobacter sp.]
MTIEITTLLVSFIVFIATLIRSAFGFGEALVAVPLLAFCIPLDVAAPLAVLVSITIAGIVVVQDWKKIHLLSAGWLLLATLFGIPLGLLLLTSSHHRIVKAALGVIIIAFSIYSLIGRTPLELKRDNRGWLLVCGFCAGVLGGAY